MEQQQIHQALSRINDAFADQHYDQSLRLARELKAALLSTDTPDPLSLGWSRFYELKSLYQLEHYAQAFDLLESNEPASWVVSVKNAAYMFSLGSELAMHLERPDDVVRWGKRCLDARLGQEDLKSAVQCANTVCVLLGRLERDDLNGPFAMFLLETGRKHGVERPLIAAVRFLADHVTRTGDGDLAAKVVAALPELQAIDDARYRDEAMSAIDAVVSSSELLHALTPSEQRRIQAEFASADGTG